MGLRILLRLYLSPRSDLLWLSCSLKRMEAELGWVRGGTAIFCFVYRSADHTSSTVFVIIDRLTLFTSGK